MRKLLYILVLIGTAFSAFAQNAETYCKSASLKEGQLDFLVTIPAKTIGNDEVLMVKPTLTMERGDKVSLQPLLIIGKGQYPYYRRSRALQDRWGFERSTPHQFVIAASNAPASIRYQSSITGEATSLLLEYEVLNCCDIRSLGSQNLSLKEAKLFQLEKGMISPFITPRPVERKVRNEELEAHFHYHLDKDLLLKDFRGNSAEIERVRRAMAYLFENKDMYTILSGEIIGYASPEGDATYNQDLSRRRAESVRKYFSETYPEVGRFVAVGKGDNWEELEAALPNYELKDKAELVRLVQQKDKEGLMAHPEYGILLRDVYPLLRVSKLVILYSPRNVNVEEAEKLLYTHPKDLSLAECYEAIEALVEKGKDRLELHQLVLQGHPSDAVARVNYSGLALEKGAVDEAMDALKELDEDPLAANNLGLIYAIRGDYKRAEVYFMKSNEPIARENLAKVQSLK